MMEKKKLEELRKETQTAIDYHYIKTEYGESVLRLIHDYSAHEKTIDDLEAELIESYEEHWLDCCNNEVDGWRSHSFMSDQEQAAARLVELGAYEKHPTKEWFREIKEGGGDALAVWLMELHEEEGKNN